LATSPARAPSRASLRRESPCRTRLIDSSTGSGDDDGSPLSDKFIGADNLSTQILTVVLIVLMSVTTFTTQRQLMMKNMPAAALDNPFAQQQKILLYVLPLVFAVSGVNFPIGVLIYWLTTNLWSMGQQFYVIRRMPAPGSPAEKALKERQARRGKAAKRGKAEAEAAASDALTHESGDGAAADGATGGQRLQPKRQQPRSKRVGGGRPRSGRAQHGGQAGPEGAE
jgi:YidC/Oxa1 family membrane protein insertase